MPSIQQDPSLPPPPEPGKALARAPTDAPCAPRERLLPPRPHDPSAPVLPAHRRGAALAAWLRPSRHLDEFVLQPACNPRGGVEWDASLAMAHAAGGASSTSLGLQAKTAFRTVEPGESYGERHARPARQLGLRTWLRPQRLQLDATLGHEPFDGRGETFATIGLVWFREQVVPPRSAR